MTSSRHRLRRHRLHRSSCTICFIFGRVSLSLMASSAFSFSCFFSASSILRLRAGRTNNPPSSHAPPPFDLLHWAHFRHRCLGVPSARRLALTGPLVACLARSATKHPRHIISVGCLGPSTTGVCNRFNDKPIPLGAATERPRRHRQRRPLGRLCTGCCSRRDDRPTLPLPTPNSPGVIATDDYFEPPTPYQPPLRLLRVEHKTSSPPRPLSTPSPTQIHETIQRQPPRLHAQRRNGTFSHQGHLLVPSSSGSS